MKIYVNVDMEGISGVFKFEQTRNFENALFREALGYMMGDIAAVVKGLKDAAVDEILVLDAHNGGHHFVPHLMEPGAKYITGMPRPGALYGLDKSVDGMIMLGFHAMRGTPDGVLHHTQSSKSENRYWYNGVESGELVQDAVIAGHFDVPPIMVSGDEATCREARRFFGKTCVTVAVKKGISREAAILYPFEETRKALYEGAQKAVAAIPQCKPFKLKMPIKAKLQFISAVGNETKVVTRKAILDSPLNILKFV